MSAVEVLMVVMSSLWAVEWAFPQVKAAVTA